MNFRVIVSLCLAVAIGAGCPLRKDAVGPGGADASADRLDMRSSNDVVTPDGLLDIPVGATGGTGTAGQNGSNGGNGGNGELSGPGGAGGATSGGPDASAGGGPGTRDLSVACSSKSDCASGNCVDGVCCDGACADSCSACNLKDFVGHCTPLSVGTAPASPHPACTKMAATTCKQNGLCDGKGACQLYPSGEVCGGGTCNATTQTSVTGSTCDGVGTCKQATGVICTPFKCKSDGTGCATTCTGDADCQGQPCVAGSCGKVADGSKCTAAGQCTSGNCVDGYCCDVACGESCRACDLAGSIGKCAALPVNQPPRNARPACAAGTCGGHCDGTSPTCVFAPKTTSCGTAKCVAGMATPAVSCDGLGACPVATANSCGGFACLGTACRTSCGADTDCVAPTPYCNANACQAAKPLGRTCVAGTECAGGGNCVNGVCCSTSSCAPCQACNLATPGTCSNKPAATADAACLSSNCKSGTCNGMGVCNQAADGAVCGTNRFCSTGTCGACTPNQACQPANPCKNGMTSCGTGMSTCLESTNKALNSPCGLGQSCMGMTKTTAALCNATGVCGARTPSNCPNGCNMTQTDCLTCGAGQTACNGICCQAGQGCCGQACVDITASPAHCGTSCTVCGPGALQCVAGGCVQCVGDQDCSVKTPTCDVPTHTCVCRRPSATNRIVNGGFNTNLSGWPTGSWGWSTDDADQCAQSGSVFESDMTGGALSQCVPVVKNTAYFFGAKFKHLDPQNNFSLCVTQFYMSPDCNDTPVNGPMLGPVSGNLSGWVMAGPITVNVPDLGSPTVSLNIQCFLTAGAMDQMYLNTVNRF